MAIKLALNINKKNIQCILLNRPDSESSRPPSEAHRRPTYHTQGSATAQHEVGHRHHNMSASAGTKVKPDDIFGSIKRRRTTPPGWTGFQSTNDEYNNHVINGGRIRQEDDDDDPEELLGPEEEAQGNLVSL